jgi:hypothetical protein
MNITKTTVLLAMASKLAPAFIAGRKLARILHDANATEKALIDDALRKGALIVTSMTGPQAQSVTGANTAYASLVRHLSPAQRHNVETGAYPLGRVARLARQPDYQADRVVRRYGQDRLLAALDRAAAPTPTGYERARGNGANGNGAALPARAAFER